MCSSLSELIDFDTQQRKFLTYIVVQLTGNAAAFFIVGRDQPGAQIQALLLNSLAFSDVDSHHNEMAFPVDRQGCGGEIEGYLPAAFCQESRLFLNMAFFKYPGHDVCEPILAFDRVEIEQVHLRDFASGILSDRLGLLIPANWAPGFVEEKKHSGHGGK